VAQGLLVVDLRRAWPIGNASPFCTRAAVGWRAEFAAGAATWSAGTTRTGAAKRWSVGAIVPAMSWAVVALHSAQIKLPQLFVQLFARQIQQAFAFFRW
jgi:hypothetical protein